MVDDEFQREFVVTISETIAGSIANTMLPTKVVFWFCFFIFFLFFLILISFQNSLNRLETVQKIFSGTLLGSDLKLPTFDRKLLLSERLARALIRLWSLCG